MSFYEILQYFWDGISVLNALALRWVYCRKELRRGGKLKDKFFVEMWGFGNVFRLFSRIKSFSVLLFHLDYTKKYHDGS